MLKEKSDITKWSYDTNFKYDSVPCTPKFIIKQACVTRMSEKYRTVMLELREEDTELLNVFNAQVEAPGNVGKLAVTPCAKIYRHTMKTLKIGDYVNVCVEHSEITEWKEEKYNKYTLKSFLVVDEPKDFEMDVEDLA